MWATAGDTLAGRYRLVQQVGRGGMGSVWLARDLTLNRSVAVKIVHSTLSGDPRGQDRLRREARMLGGMSHPGLARVFDLGATADAGFIVMEFVEGESLAARLDREPQLEPGEAARIAAQCAEALDAAHRAGVVHRDVKPSNIMLTGDTVKIIDFGIASSTDPAGTTATFGLIGTAAYLAPERASGAQATAAADVYSLGVVLYRMLAGRLPFNADGSIDMLYAHTATAPLPLPATVPSVLADLCLSLLTKDPLMRPRSGVAAVALHRVSARQQQFSEQAVPAAQAVPVKVGR